MVDSCFKKEFLDKLWMPRMAAQVLDIGFVRYEKGVLSEYYVVVILQDMKSAIARYNYKLQPSHLYVTFGTNLEMRYNMKGELDGTYLTRDENTIVRVEDNQIYDIEGKVKRFPKEFEELKNIIDKDDDEFKYFTKRDGEVVYLYIQNKCTCEIKEPIQLYTHTVCNKCKRLTD